jgi:hypothetical protein
VKHDLWLMEGEWDRILRRIFRSGKRVKEGAGEIR